MSVTEASHTQIPSRGMCAWKKKTSLWQWQTARCGSRFWIRSRLPGPPDDDDDDSDYDSGSYCDSNIESVSDSNSNVTVTVEVTVAIVVVIRELTIRQGLAPRR